MGSRSAGKTHLQGSGFSGRDSALEMRDLPAKALTDSLSIRIPGPSSHLSPDIPVNWGWGVGVSCPAAVPSCPPQLAEAEKRREDGRHLCSSENTGPLRTNSMWSLGGCCRPLRFPWPWARSKGEAPPWTCSDVSRQGSGVLSAQT